MLEWPRSRQTARQSVLTGGESRPRPDNQLRIRHDPYPRPGQPAVHKPIHQKRNQKKELYGFETYNDFYHLTDLETFKKLQDL